MSGKNSTTQRRILFHKENSVPFFSSFYFIFLNSDLFQSLCIELLTYSASLPYFFFFFFLLCFHFIHLKGNAFAVHTPSLAHMCNDIKRLCCEIGQKVRNMDTKGILKYGLGMRMLSGFIEDNYIYLGLELH